MVGGKDGKAKIALWMTVGKSDISYTGHKPPGLKFKPVVRKKYNRRSQRNYCAANPFKFAVIFHQSYPASTSVLNYVGIVDI